MDVIRLGLVEINPETLFLLIRIRRIHFMPRKNEEILLLRLLLLKICLAEIAVFVYVRQRVILDQNLHFLIENRVSIRDGLGQPLAFEWRILTVRIPL